MSAWTGQPCPHCRRSVGLYWQDELGRCNNCGCGTIVCDPATMQRAVHTISGAEARHLGSIWEIGVGTVEQASVLTETDVLDALKAMAITTGSQPFPVTADMVQRGLDWYRAHFDDDGPSEAWMRGLLEAAIGA